MVVKILLKKLREESGLSGNELARLTGLSPQYLGKLERGDGNPSLVVIDTLCEALDCQPGDLLVRVKDEEAKP